MDKQQPAVENEAIKQPCDTPPDDKSGKVISFTDDEIRKEKEKLHSNEFAIGIQENSGQGSIHNYNGTNYIFIGKEEDKKPDAAGEIYHLDEEKSFSDFMEKNAGSRTCAIALTLCLLEVIPTNDLNTYANQLLTRLQDFFQIDEENKHKENHLPYQKILSSIHATSCVLTMHTETGDVAVEGVKFVHDDTCEKMRRFIWKQYFNLHSLIIDFIFELFENASKSIVRKAAGALGSFCSMDFLFAKQIILHRLTQTDGDKYLFITNTILVRLVNCEEYRENVYNLLSYWSGMENITLWKTVLYFYSENNMNIPNIEKILDKSLNKYSECTSTDVKIDYDFFFVFIGQLAHISPELLQIVLKHLVFCFNNTRVSVKKNTAVHMYLLIIAGEYFSTNEESPYLHSMEFKDICDSSMDSVQKYINYIMNRYEFRGKLLEVLKVYITEFDSYKNNQDIHYEFLDTFIQVIIDNKLAYENFYWFLQSLIEKRIPSKTAKKLMERMANK